MLDSLLVAIGRCAGVEEDFHFMPDMQVGDLLAMFWLRRVSGEPRVRGGEVLAFSVDSTRAAGLTITNFLTTLVEKMRWSCRFWVLCHVSSTGAQQNPSSSEGSIMNRSIKALVMAALAMVGVAATNGGRGVECLGPGLRAGHLPAVPLMLALRT